MNSNKDGSILFILTVCMMILVNVTAVAYYFAAQSRAKMARYHMDMEKSVYSAETGIERSIAYLMAGGNETNLTGTVNGATYVVTIVEKN